MSESLDAYRYFYQDGKMHGPYSIRFQHDPSKITGHVKYVTAYYSEPYKPIRGFKNGLPKEEGKVRVDGPMAQLWLKEPKNEKAIQLFIEHYRTLADRHKRLMDEANEKADNAEKLLQTMDIQEPEMMKKRRSDRYMIYDPGDINTMWI